MNVLVVAAHPDDEVLGCGGTMARLAREGHAVHAAILGEGATSRYATREKAGRKDVESLDRRSREALKRLGGKQVHAFGLPDNRFDTVPLLDIIKIVETLIEKLRPEVIYTHHNGDVNVDHVATHRAVLTATRPQAGFKVREVLAFEIPSSTEWAFDRLERPFQPNIFVDISRTLPLKLKALDAYSNEMRPFPHPRSRTAITAQAKRRGSAAGFKAAEAFELVRGLR